MKIENQNNILIVSRYAYLGLAALWWVVNKEHFVLSEWDAQRINVPIFLYLGTPIIALALYAIRPSSATWAFVVFIFTLGFGLHVYESLKFDIDHLGVKTDITSTAIQMAAYLLVFVFCSAAMYMSGPYIRKKYGTSKKI